MNSRTTECSYFDYIEHTFYLLIDMCLTTIGILIIYLNVLWYHARAKLHCTTSILNTCDITPIATVEIGKIKATNRFAFMGKHQVNVCPIIICYFYFKVIKYVVHPLWNPGERMYVFSCFFVCVLHLGRSLYRLQ